MAGVRCSDLSRAAGEPLAGTATAAERLLLLEVPGRWPRDVAGGDGLPGTARDAVARWATSEGERRRVLFVRRPGRERPGAAVFVASTREAETELRRLDLPGLATLAELDLENEGTAVSGPLVLVCGHGSRDACCALRGTSLYNALRPRFGEDELWLSSHHGGHRFAANVLVLPSGIQLGRVEPGEGAGVVDRALSGRIALDRYRGRICHDPAVQAAEHAVRVAHELDEVGAVSLLAVEGPVVRFRLPGRGEAAARVVAETGPAVPASCGDVPEPQRRFRAELL